MDIHKIKYLDCTLDAKHLKNRILLLKATMEAIREDEKPSRELLEKWAASLSKKYNMPWHIVRQTKSGYLMVSVEVEPGAYSTLDCHSYYEALCKYILLVKEYRRIRGMSPK